MKESELKEILERHGYILEKIIRFKRHDRIKFETPREVTVTLNLRMHLEEIPKYALLKWILNKEELEKEIKRDECKG